MSREKIKIEIEEDRVVVHTRQPDWESASGLISSWRSLPPEGYKLVNGSVKTRGSSGAACNLRLLFVHCDSRIDPFTEEEAYLFFRSASKDLAGNDLDPDPLVGR